MIAEFVVRNPRNISESDTLIEISESIRAQVVERVINADAKWGFDCSAKYHFLNNYDNDDYLFVADLILDVCELHKTIYFNPNEQKWIRGCSPLPHIHLEFIEESPLKKASDGTLVTDDEGKFIPDDTKLNMGVRPPDNNGAHILRFNYYWLKQYVKFLVEVFDDNSEIVFSLPEECLQSIHSMGTYEDIMNIVDGLRKSGLEQQAKPLQIYALSHRDNNKIPIPTLAFFEENGVQKGNGWVLVDEKRKVITLDLKKKIYNTSGFAGLFDERKALLVELFLASLKMIIGHEVAHIARGHWNMRIQEKEYSMQRNVMLNCEINADWTSLKWLVNELLYDTVDGNPHSNILAYKRDDLVFLWAVRIFSSYLSLGWGYRGNERIWSTETIERFSNDDAVTHPLYQIRQACLLMHAEDHLEHMKNQSCKENSLYTADKYRIDGLLFDAVWTKAMDMINSFEVGLRTSWGKDIRSFEQQLRDNLRVEETTRQTNKYLLPFMLAVEPSAKEELVRIENEWSEVKRHLQSCGSFYPMTHMYED